MVILPLAMLAYMYNVHTLYSRIDVVPLIVYNIRIEYIIILPNITDIDIAIETHDTK